MMPVMPQKKHKPEEIVAKLRQVDVLLSQGRPVAEASRLSPDGERQGAGSEALTPPSARRGMWARLSWRRHSAAARFTSELCWRIDYLITSAGIVVLASTSDVWLPSTTFCMPRRP